MSSHPQMQADSAGASCSETPVNGADARLFPKQPRAAGL